MKERKVIQLRLLADRSDPQADVPERGLRFVSAVAGKKPVDTIYRQRDEAPANTFYRQQVEAPADTLYRQRNEKPASIINQTTLSQRKYFMKTNSGFRFFFAAVKCAALFLLLLVMPFLAKAGKYTWSNRINGSSIAPYAIQTLREDIYVVWNPTWNTGWKHCEVKNRVVLGIDRSSLAAVTTPFTAKVKVLVSLRDAVFASSVFTEELEVSYDPSTGVVDTDKAWVERANGHQMSVMVQTVTLTGVGSTSQTPNLYLESFIEVERYKEFDFDTPLAATQVAHAFIGTEGELEVRWDALPGAEEYELEWTYVTAEYPWSIPGTSTSYPIPALSELKYDFKNNATRITTPEQYFRIPMLYDRGYLLYRVRGVGRHTDTEECGHRLVGDWSICPSALSNESGSMADWDAATLLPSIGDLVGSFIYAYEGHERVKNWQAGVTYAEDGKHAAAISYHDGALYNRQSVTKSSTEKMAIVGETFYDHQGRPAVAALPVPAFAALIEYYEHFNRNSSGSPVGYSRADFDLDPGDCTVESHPFSEAHGAGYYYSPGSMSQYSSGPWSVSATREHSRAQYYVPQAGGFPFVQTTYTNDNTGRIASQSSAGGAHHLGSGHEVRNWYGDAGQTELDRLFGTEVGSARHYRKNMTMDANGQISVSYLNAGGKVVATALAGESPDGLIALEDNVVQPDIREDMLQPNEADIEEGVLLSSTEILVTGEGEQTLEYEITGESYTAECGGVLRDRCYDCVYDLFITVLDECGNEVLGTNAAGTGTAAPLSVRIEGSALDATCETPALHYLAEIAGGPAGALPMFLKPGKYTVMKRLKVAEDVMEYYLNDYLTSLPCIKSLDDFLAEEEIDTSGCGIDCGDCVNSALLDPPPFAADPSFAEFCEEHCEVNWCAPLYEAMRQDMSPGGQYGLYKTEETAVGSGIYEYVPDGKVNMFSGEICLLTTPGAYKYPCTPYMDEDGVTPSLVENSAGILVSPEDLSVDEFIENWKDSWSASLICHHPEYCYYEYCSTELAASNDFDTEWMLTETYLDASSKGFLNPTPATAAGIPAPSGWLDPYFTTASPWAQVQMLLRLAGFATGGSGSPIHAWDAAASMFQCAGAPAPCGMFGANPDTRDEEWLSFRAFYLAIKQQIQREHFMSAPEHEICKNKLSIIDEGWPLPFPDCSDWEDKVRHTQLSVKLFDMEYSYPPGATLLTDLIAAAESLMTDHCANTCAAYMEGWRMMLQDCIDDCGLSPAEVEDLLNDLQGVCREGCDESNPMGAGTVSSGSPGYWSTTAGEHFHSFEEVQNYYFRFCTLSVCHSPLLNWPMPYDHSSTSISTSGLAPCVDLSQNYFHDPSFDHAYEPFPVGGGTEYITSLVQGVNCGDIEDCPGTGGCPTTPALIRNAGHYAFKTSPGCWYPGNWTGKPRGYDPTASPTQLHHMLVNGFEYSGSLPNPGPWLVLQDIMDVTYNPPSIEPTHTFYFSGYAMNLRSSPAGTDPVLEVVADVGGTTYRLAGPVVIGFEPGEWQKMEGSITLPAGTLCTIPMCNTEITVRILCYTYSRREEGNDFALDDLYFGFVKEGICCVGCDTLEAYRDEFDLTYGVPVTDENYWPTLGTWLNGELDWDRTWPEYQAIFDSCFAGPGSGVGAGVQRMMQTHPWNNDALQRDSVEENGVVRALTEQEKYGPGNVYGTDNVQRGSRDAVFCNDGLEIPVRNPCVDAAMAAALLHAQERYEDYIDSLKDAFRTAYKTKCLEATERFERIYDESEYQYTLYHYDLAGNLIQTTPPEGVRPITDASTLDAIKDTRKLGGYTPILPCHGLPTMYAYNSLGGVRYSKTPDKGESRTWYDNLGRPVYAQDARQKAGPSPSSGTEYYAYTRYDFLSRPTETGELESVIPSTTSLLEKSIMLPGPVMLPVMAVQDVVRTYYDLQTVTKTFDGATAKNLRNRVAQSTRLNSYSGTWPIPVGVYDFATHYSYDEHGNAELVLQEIKALEVMGQSLKLMEYEYDLLSGNVNEFIYQEDAHDEWRHRYFYDANNRLTVAESSRDGVIWDREAKQFYYLHGPLARVEIGTEKVQGIDYATTILGWTKVMNSGSLRTSRDQGMDGASPIGIGGSATVNMWTGQDVWGMELGFFSGDYTPVSSGVITSAVTTINPSAVPDITNMYNGNIGTWVVNQPVDKSGTLENEPLLKRYHYDQLHRIKNQQVYKESAAGLLYTGNAWDVTTAVATSDWMTRYDFDRNGNITKLVRNANGFQMDDLTYQYKFIDGDYCGAPMMEHNQLLWVDDAFSTAGFDADLEDQPGTMTAPNYVYDAAGNLKQDVSEELGNIEWDMYGKIKQVVRTAASTRPDLQFEYGPDGQRWVKVVMHDGGATDKQFYVRDASGNVLAVYTLTRETRSGLEYDQLHADEFHIYGGDRVGVLNEHILIAEFDVTSEAMTGTVVPRNPQRGKHTRGKRGYELKDHLGNVHVVVTDKRLWIDAASDGTIDYFTADVMMSTDYYPFGSEMPGRVYSSSAYRYGFNGKEKDDEFNGSGAMYDYGFRVYDPRIAKFLSVDPLAPEYPMLTPYQYASNRPIDGIDIDGLEHKQSVDWARKNISGYPFRTRQMPGGEWVERNWVYGVSRFVASNWKEKLPDLDCGEASFLAYVQSNELVKNYIYEWFTSKKKFFNPSGIRDFFKQKNSTYQCLINTDSYSEASEGDMILFDPRTSEDVFYHTAILSSPITELEPGKKIQFKAMTTNADGYGGYQRHFGEATYILEKGEDGVWVPVTEILSSGESIIHSDYKVIGFGRLDVDKLTKDKEDKTDEDD